MNLISVENLTQWASEAPLFENISFGMNTGDKRGIIGTNGCGKSTLLKILMGRIVPDGGKVVKNNKLRMTILAQNPEFDPDHTVIRHILQGDTPQLNLLREYEELLNRELSLPANQKKLQDLTEMMDHQEGWTALSAVESRLVELGIEDRYQKMGTLSGGMIKKVELAKVLSSGADLLILDEPTNHLDLDSILFLQNYLEQTDQAILLVTHDRYFLDQICNGIYEIADQTISLYEGNFSYYIEKKQEKIAAEASRQNRIKAILRDELAWLAQGPKARSHKDKKRKAGVTELQNQLSGPAEESAAFQTETRRLGKTILNLTDVTKSFDGKPIITPFSYKFHKGERIGILGPNGAGKTTFLKLLTGQYNPDDGTCEVGINTHFGIFGQTDAELPIKKTPLEFLSDLADTFQKEGGNPLTPGKLLERFQFTPGQQRNPIERLSGGERRRLYLVQVLLQNPNFLILDEPTNDLDIQTLQLLEQFLSEYSGCVVAVSHDRYFLDKMAERLFLFDGKGGIHSFTGPSEEGRKKIAELNAPKEKPAPVAPPTPARKKKKGLTFNEKREKENLESVIEDLEEKKSYLESWFGSPEALTNQMAEKQKLYDQIGRDLDQAYERWEELEEKEA